MSSGSGSTYGWKPIARRSGRLHERIEQFPKRVPKAVSPGRWQSGVTGADGARSRIGQRVPAQQSGGWSAKSGPASAAAYVAASTSKQAAEMNFRPILRILLELRPGS